MAVPSHRKQRYSISHIELPGAELDLVRTFCARVRGRLKVRATSCTDDSSVFSSGLCARFLLLDGWGRDDTEDVREMSLPLPFDKLGLGADGAADPEALVFPLLWGLVDECGYVG